jgi:hypothetical protein
MSPASAAEGMPPQKMLIWSGHSFRFDCHPGRRSAIRSLNRAPQSKDPYPLNGNCGSKRSSHPKTPGASFSRPLREAGEFADINTNREGKKPGRARLQSCRLAAATFFALPLSEIEWNGCPFRRLLKLPLFVFSTCTFGWGDQSAVTREAASTYEMLLATDS